MYDITIKNIGVESNKDGIIGSGCTGGLIACTNYHYDENSQSNVYPTVTVEDSYNSSDVKSVSGAVEVYSVIVRFTVQ